MLPGVAKPGSEELAEAAADVTAMGELAAEALGAAVCGEEGEGEEQLTLRLAGCVGASVRRCVGMGAEVDDGGAAGNVGAGGEGAGLEAVGRL